MRKFEIIVALVAALVVGSLYVTYETILGPGWCFAATRDDTCSVTTTRLDTVYLKGPKSQFMMQSIDGEIYWRLCSVVFTPDTVLTRLYPDSTVAWNRSWWRVTDGAWQFERVDQPYPQCIVIKPGTPSAVYRFDAR